MLYQFLRIHFFFLKRVIGGCRDRISCSVFFHASGADSAGLLFPLRHCATMRLRAFPRSPVPCNFFALMISSGRYSKCMRSKRSHVPPQTKPLSSKSETMAEGKVFCSGCGRSLLHCQYGPVSGLRSTAIPKLWGKSSGGSFWRWRARSSRRWAKNSCSVRDRRAGASKPRRCAGMLRRRGRQGALWSCRRTAYGRFPRSTERWSAPYKALSRG